MYPSLFWRSVVGLAAASVASTGAAAWSALSENELDFYAAAPDLRAYVNQAVERHPRVLESRARYGAASHRIPQVTALPDPVVTFTQALRSVETRVGPQRNGVTLTQSLPWFGTRELRGQIALLEEAALRHDYQNTRRKVVAEVKEAYYELGYVDAARSLALEEQSLLEHYETLARARYAAGRGRLQAVIRLQAEITRVVDRQLQLDRDRAALAARLNALLDLPADDPMPVVRPLVRPVVELDREQLYRLGERHRQELRAAGALAEGAERFVELAAMNSRPSFTASLAVIQVGRREDLAAALPLPDNGKNAISVSLGVSLPVWRASYRASVEQASDEARARSRHRAAQRNAMEMEVQAAASRFETLDRQITLFDTVLIPQSEEALRATEGEYETGELGVLELLDGERTLIEVRTMRARYLSDLLIALTELERAIGTRVPQKDGRAR